MLLQLNLSLFAAGDLFAQLVHHLFARQLRFFTIADLLIQLGDGFLHLLIEFQVAGAHLFQLIHQPCQPLPRLLKLIDHHRQKIDGPGRNQQAKENRAHHIDTLDVPPQYHRDRHLDNHRQHHQRRGQQQREPDQAKFDH